MRKLTTITTCLAVIFICTPAHALAETLGRCKGTATHHMDEEVCRLSFYGLVANAETMEGKLINVSGSISLRYGEYILTRYPSSSELNDPLDSFMLTGETSSISHSRSARNAASVPEEIKAMVDRNGSAKVSIVGRFRLGPEPSQALQNLGTIEVLLFSTLEVPKS